MKPVVVVGIAPVRAGSVAEMSGTSQPSMAMVVQQVLSSRGPMTEDELLDVLAAEGIDRGPDPEDTLAEIVDEDCELGMPLGDDGALLFEPGRLAALGVGAGDLVGLRVTADGFELVAVEALTMCEVGEQLAALIEERPDQPEMLDVAVWTVCAADDGLFREPA